MSSIPTRCEPCRDVYSLSVACMLEPKLMQYIRRVESVLHNLSQQCKAWSAKWDGGMPEMIQIFPGTEEKETGR